MEAAWQHFKQMADQERLAHAHLVIGTPAVTGRAFASLAAKYLFCSNPAKPDGCACPPCHRVDQGTHPDFHWVEPQGKSRTILVEQVDGLLHDVYSTSFEGGWKVFAVAYAERINRDAGNKLLKAIEEPPPNTLILLLTTEPQSVLGTLVSRCQRIALHDAAEVEQPVWHEDLYAILRQGPPRAPFDTLVQAAAFTRLFDRVKQEMLKKVEAEFAGREEVTEEQIEARATAAAKEEWAAMFGQIDRWYRDLYVLASGGDAGHVHHTAEMELLKRQAQGGGHGALLRRLQNIDRIAGRIDRNLQPQVAFETLLNEH